MVYAPSLPRHSPQPFSSPVAESLPGVTRLDDAAHLAEALAFDEGCRVITRYEAAMQERAKSSAVEAAEGLQVSYSSAGVATVLRHYSVQLPKRSPAISIVVR